MSFAVSELVSSHSFTVYRRNLLGDEGAEFLRLPLAALTGLKSLYLEYGTQGPAVYSQKALMQSLKNSLSFSAQFI